MKLRALVVDDTALFRRLVQQALEKLPDVEVAGTVSNGKLALARIKTLKPDLVTLDIEMPEMNGIEVLEALAQAHGDGGDMGVIMLSSHTVRGGELTMRALALGAFDFVTKPEGGTPEDNATFLVTSLRRKVEAFRLRKESRARMPARLTGVAPASVRQPPPAATAPLARIQAPPMVLIGVSTGGPAALAEILPAIPAGFPAPVFVVQHMPPLFTEALAHSLQTRCKLAVRSGADGEIAMAGTVYIAPGGKHMRLCRGPGTSVVIRLDEGPLEHHCRPAVDVLFRSAAASFPGRSVAVVLTGMGCDGTAGLRELKSAGCISIAQDEASCTVFGMPREAIQAGLADRIVPLHAIAATLERMVSEAK